MVKNINKKLLAGVIAAGIAFVPAKTCANEDHTITTIGDSAFFVPSDCEEKMSSGIVLEEVAFYTGPGTNYERIHNIAVNTEVDIMGKCDTGWYLISCGDMLGFVDGQFVSETYGLDFTPAVEATTAVNVRQENNVDSEILGSLHPNEKVEMLQKMDNGWYRVKYNNLIGYVHGDYVVESSMITGDFKNISYVNGNYPLYDKPNGNMIEVLPYLETCKVFGEYGDYYLVEASGRIGFIQKNYCTPLNGTFVVVDRSDQNLTLYQNNKELLSTSVTTGKDSTPSDCGLFYINDKSTNTTLVGDGYESFVYYWMPYNGGEGLHDAPWRECFGGEDYHYAGSHGCVNMPYDAAAKVYSNVDIGDKVLVKE